MNKKRVAGLVLIILSAVISLGSITLTGAIIGPAYFGFVKFITVSLFIAGVILVLTPYDQLIKEPEKTATKYRRLRSGGSGDPNKQARYFARQTYKEEHGCYPTTIQLRAFLRERHEKKGAIRDLVEEQLALVK